MEKPSHEFTTKFWTVLANYESHVKVYEDRVTISRTGRTNGLPADLTIYFRDTTSVSWGSVAGRAWIKFTVPGVVGKQSDIVEIKKPGTFTFSTGDIPVDDPFCILFGMRQENDASWYYGKIKKLFDTYKSKMFEQQPAMGATTIYQEGVMDKLRKLKDLKDMGILTDLEYEEKRQKLLAEI